MHVLFCSSFDLLYDKVKQRQKFEYFHFTSDEATLFKFKNNLRMILGSKPEKFKKIEAREKVSYS